MKKLISSLKDVNRLGLLALLLVGFVTMAFSVPQKSTANAVLTEYGRDADGNWIAVGSAQPGEGPGQYTCEFSQEICRANFESQPAQGAQPLPQNIVESDGEYLLH